LTVSLQAGIVSFGQILMRTGSSWMGNDLTTGIGLHRSYDLVSGRAGFANRRTAMIGTVGISAAKGVRLADRRLAPRSGCAWLALASLASFRRGPVAVGKELPGKRQRAILRM